MEEIKSTKAKQISKTSNAKLSKFKFFDKCKSADVNSSKNNTPSVHAKIRECTERKDYVYTNSQEHSPDSAQSNQELQYSASQLIEANNKGKQRISFTLKNCSILSFVIVVDY